MDGNLVFLCVCILSYQEALSAITSTCNAQPVTAGETATVTCHLGEDIKSHGHDLIVQRYVKNRYPHPGVAEMVMHCSWPDDREQGYKCVTYRNFTRTTDVTETVTVALPNAQKDTEGLYYCEVMGGAYGYATCSLRIEAVSAITSTCHAEQVTAGGTATVTCHFGGDVKAEGHDVVVQRRMRNMSYPEMVMHCYWPNDRKQGYTCAMFHNFTHTTDVTETVTIALPNPQKDAEGLYYCMVDDKAYRYAMCSLRIGIAPPENSPLITDNDHVWVVVPCGLVALMVQGVLLWWILFKQSCTRTNKRTLSVDSLNDHLLA